MDNPSEWSVMRVAVDVTHDDVGAQDQILHLTVDDDGLTPSEGKQVVKRGGRLDESKSTSGPGLSIVQGTGRALWRRAHAQ